VTDSTNNKIRQVQISNGAVSSLTGTANTPGPLTNMAVDGSATSATFNNPTGITTDGTNLYVADSGNSKIRVFNLSTNIVSSLWTGLNNTSVPAGAADTASLYQGLYPTFNSPQSITTDGTYLYVADTYNSKIRSINISTLAVTSVTGIPNTSGTFGATDGGAGTTANPLATFSYPMGITTDGVSLYVTDNANFTVRKIQ
jgi:sugar lactone lactonase YvrE